MTLATGASGARRWLPLAVAAACAFAVAAVGGALTDIGPWYRDLVKPSFQPPDWAFGPAWTLIFALCAVAGAQSWQRAPNLRARTAVIVLFAVNAVLNVGWSLLFFRLRRPDWALLEVGLLWLSIVALILVCGRFAPRVRLLLLPYLAWVSFATLVNAEVVRLNAPFSGGGA
jgi:benzodiazapine receptor